MLPPIFSTNLNLNQTEDILQHLSNIPMIADKGDSTYLASKKLTEVPFELSEKIDDYLSTFDGFNNNLFCLPPLTKQIVKFMKSEEGYKVDEQRVMSAIEGLSVLLNIKGPKNKDEPYIEEAINDLLTALGVAVIQKKMHEPEKSLRLMDYIWQKAGSILPHLSISFVINQVAEKASYYFGYKIENPLFKPAFEKINQFIYLHTLENDPDFKKAVKSFFRDEKLTSTKKIELNDQFIDVPSQFYADCARFRTLVINDKKIFDLNQSNPSSSKEISMTMAKEFGAPTFQRLGAIIHQSFIADQAVKWFIENWPDAWRESGSPFEQAFISQADGFHFTVNQNGEAIHIRAMIILKLGVPVNDEIRETYKLSKQDSHEVGYLVLDRQVFVKKDELLDDLNNLTGEAMLPGLSVKQTVSDFYPTMQEASNFLQALK